jgi:hypothetical protein
VVIDRNCCRNVAVVLVVPQEEEVIPGAACA